MYMRLRASFTVEASLLMPMILFMLIGFLYACFFVHDKAVLQSCALRQGEAALFADEGETDTESPDDALIAMEDVSGSRSLEGFSLTGSIREWLGIQSVTCTFTGSITNMIPGSAAYTGDVLSVKVTETSATVNYPQDFLRKKVLTLEGE